MRNVRVLFVYPDFLEATKHNKNIPGNYSEGLASLSAVLKENGHLVSLYHLTSMPLRKEFLDHIRAQAPDMIGFSIRTSALRFAAEMAGWLDEDMPEIHVMAGMYHPSLAPEEVIALRGVDAVCIGEGEYPCLDFINAYAESAALATSIESFWVKTPDGQIHKNPIRPFVADLDQLPFPDLDLFDYPNLRSNIQHYTAEVIVSRGCIYSCTYCANAQLRSIYPDKTHYARFRSPENAIALLERVLAKDPKIECFSFNDAILNVYKDWFYAFTALYKQRIKKKYVCNLRFDLLDEAMIRELVESGCYLVTIGLENGDEEFRKKYLRRSIQNDHIVEVSHMLKRAGIIVNTYNIVGLPHETLPLALETIKLNARMHTDNVVVSFFYPYPTTEIRRIAEEAGFLDPQIGDSDPVRLRMPDYRKSDILYIKYSFLRLIHAYRKLYIRYAGEQREQEIRRLDARILSPHHPRALIGMFRTHTHFAEIFAKRVAARYLPALYKVLRRMRDKRAAGGKK